MNFQILKIIYLKFPQVMHKIIVTIIILKPVEVNEKKEGKLHFFQTTTIFQILIHFTRNIFIYPHH